MAFVVEDGTGVVGANSFGAVAGADAYFSDRGIAAWTGAQAVKEAALINGTDYIEKRFSGVFIGERNEATQSLSWPRNNGNDGVLTTRSGVEIATDEIPENLKRATYEYALRALSGALAPDPEVDASGATVVTTRKKVGPLEKEFQVLGQSSSGAIIRPYPAADLLLVDLVVSSNRVIR